MVGSRGKVEAFGSKHGEKLEDASLINFRMGDSSRASCVALTSLRQSLTLTRRRISRGVKHLVAKQVCTQTAERMPGFGSGCVRAA